MTVWFLDRHILRFMKWEDDKQVQIRKKAAVIMLRHSPNFCMKKLRIATDYFFFYYFVDIQTHFSYSRIQLWSGFHLLTLMWVFYTNSFAFTRKTLLLFVNHIYSSFLSYYRSNSILNKFYKLLKFIIHHHVLHYIKLNPNQHNFTKSEFGNYSWLSVVCSQLQADVYYLRSSKCFDLVSHNLLLHESSSFAYVSWFRSY